MENVVVTTFEQAPEALAALHELENLDDTGGLRMRAAAVVERQQDGRFSIAEESERAGYAATLSGGLVGAIVGALAGPAGLLLGGAAGLLIGSLGDEEANADVELILTAMIRSVGPGTTALVAEVDEETNEILDRAMEELGGTVHRQPRGRCWPSWPR